MAVNLKIVSQVVASGTPGPAGKSAYQIAVDKGFKGTESEWLKELHPFKGWFDSVSELEEKHSSPSVGEYAYVKGATSSDPVKIYECSTEGSWSDSGRTVDTSTVQTFRSGEAVNDVDITDDSSDIEENSDKIPTAGAVSDALGNVELSTGEKVKNVGIDSEPTAGSDNLVKSGGVQHELALGAVYDVSAKNPTAGLNNDGKWESLSALLSDANLNNLIPTSVRKGGMSIKFIQSSDNKYVQARHIADEFTTDTAQWAIEEEGVYVENSEFIYVKTDNEGKILWAIKIDGDIYYGAGCPQQVIDYIEKKIAELSLDEYEDIVGFLSDYLGSDTTLKAMINGINAQIETKLDAKGLDPDALGTVTAVENPEWLQVIIDSEDKILEGITPDCVKKINLTIDTPSATIEHVEQPEWLSVTTDSDGNILEGIRADGSKYIAPLGTKTDYATKKDVLEESDSIKAYYDERERSKCSIYLYPFRILTNKPVYIYKDSICTGFKPESNYDVFNKDGHWQDYSPKCFKILITEAGNSYYLKPAVRDKYENIVAEKRVTFTARNAPLVKLSNKEVLNVLWLGDSIIGQNANAIGKEWKRMLATNDQESHIAEDNSIQLPTLNVCPNKINLVGEQGTYQFTQKVHQWLTGKRNSDYGAQTSDWNIENPFYNPYSTEPDEIGEDGFNKRVDFAWYFTHAIGEEKYPDLIYLAIGVNDLAYTYNWKESGIPYVVNDVVAFCKKVKTACDTIAGGSSGLKIKIFNHQTYPMYNSFFSFERQRILWKEYYDAIYEAINNSTNGIDSFVELIDCASKFDWTIGYEKVNVSNNPRYNGVQDFYYLDSVHMNLTGAYNYADCMIDDFIADEDYD